MLSQPLPAAAAAAAAAAGCYGNVASSCSSVVSVIRQSQDSRTGTCGEVTQAGGVVTSRGGHGHGHDHPRQSVNSQPGYMQMTRAASVR